MPNPPFLVAFSADPSVKTGCLTTDNAPQMDDLNEVCNVIEHKHVSIAFWLICKT